MGQFAISSAQMLGAAKVIIVDRVPERLRMAEDAGIETINFERDRRAERPARSHGRARPRPRH